MKKIRTIQVLRIIACIGVFGGHFFGIALPSEMSKDFLAYLRNSWISRTMLSFFYQGDTNVIIFYVIGGFFLVYSSRKCSNFKNICIKLFSKISNLLILSVVIILLSAGSYWVLNYFGSYRLSFDLGELVNDLRKLIVPGEEMYYAYQLWYIRTMLRCYILGTIIWICISKERRLKHIIYIVCIIVFGMKQSAAYFSVIIGMMAADYGEDVINSKKKIKYATIFSLLLFMFAPFTYNEQHLGSINKIILAMVIAVAIFFLVIAEENLINIMEINGKNIDWFEANSYAFYLVHVLVLNVVSYPLYELLMLKFAKYEMLVIIMNYMVSMLIVWVVANIFNNIIIKRNKKVIIRY